MGSPLLRPLTKSLWQPFKTLQDLDVAERPIVASGTCTSVCIQQSTKQSGYRRFSTAMQKRSGYNLQWACAISLGWLAVLTLMDVALNGAMRSTLLYAMPVALVAWGSLIAGFLFAALSAWCAWAGGAIPSPHVVEPVWVEGMWAFAKLSVIAIGTHWVHTRTT